jgi:hypothetical protein
MVKTLFFIFASVLAAYVSAIAEQQDPAEMQAQMHAADQQLSHADAIDYKTPLKTFNKYFASLQSFDFKAHLDCFTDNGKSAQLDGESPTDAVLNQRAALAAQENYSDTRLDSFLFHTDSIRPQITVIISALKNQTRSSEKVTLTLIDTSKGWKIDGEDIQNL